MLPDFPTIKRKIINKSIEELKEKIYDDPFISKIPVHRIYEGNALATRSINGYEDKGPIQEQSSGFEISKEEIIEKGPEAFFGRMDQIAQDLVDQRTHSMIQKFEEMTERTQNIISGENGPLTPDLILELLEKIQISFNDRGEPQNYMIILRPEMREKIIEVLKEIENDPDLRKRHNEIMKIKRREWIARENNRKLVE
jgi:hypothetical protein